MIVIDVGCASYGQGHESVRTLIDKFHPHVLYGFDPLEQTRTFSLNGTLIKIERKAAWTFDGEVDFVASGLVAHVAESLGPMTPVRREKVPCFDLAAFIRSLPQDEIVLKLDCEGAEYPLLEHLIKTKTDELLKLAWVEWHDPMGGISLRQRAIEGALGCEVREWM